MFHRILGNGLSTLLHPFFMKSLMDDLISNVDPPAKDLYFSIWKDQYSTKIKKILWEPSWGVVNT